jgi:phospholipid/cholesterol/gamma-HCH transport system substrate-binding protein
MSASENKRSLIVGLFVFIGLIILVAGILVMGTQQNKFSKNLKVTSYFKDVKGLKVGNNVWFSGVKVGIVKEIAFESVENVRVTMNIEEKNSQFIRKDVLATLGSDGLIGNSIISLVGGNAQTPQIQEGDVLQENGTNLSVITQNFAKLSQQMVDGKGVVGALMTDDAIATNLKTSVQSMNKVMTDASVAVNNLVALTQKLNSNQGLIHDLTTDTKVFASLRDAAAQLQGVTQTANALVENLNQTSSRLNDKDNAIGVLTNDPAAAQEIKQILRNLNTSTEKLDQNMEALQSNFLFRGFFKKKEKEEQKEVVK